MSLEKRALKGTIASLIALVVQLGLQLLTVPVLLEHWGEEEYGVWLAVNSLYSLLVTIDAGHQGYVGSELMQLVPVGDDVTRRMVQAGVGGAFVTASIELLVTITLGATGGLVALAGVSEDRTVDVWICVGALMAMWTSVGSVSGVLVRLYQPMGEFARATWIGIVQRTAMGLAPVVVAAIGGSLRQATIAVAAISFSFGCYVFFDLSHRMKLYRPFFAKPDWALVGRNLFRSIWVTAAGFVAQAQQHFFLLVVASSLGGVAALPAFTTMRTVANIFLQGANTLSAPLLPDIIRFKAAAEFAKLELLLRAIAALSTFVMGVALMGALPVLPTAYAAWTRGHTAFHSPLYGLLAAAVLVRVLGSPALSLLMGLNALVPLLSSAAIQFVVTVGFGALLVPMDGLRGAGLAVLFGEIAGSLLVPFVALRLQERELAILVRPTALLLAAAPLAIVTSGLVLHAYLDVPPVVVTGTALVALSAVAAPLWRSFPDNIRTRLLRLVRLA